MCVFGCCSVSKLRPSQMLWLLDLQDSRIPLREKIAPLHHGFPFTQMTSSFLLIPKQYKIYWDWFTTRCTHKQHQWRLIGLTWVFHFSQPKLTGPVDLNPAINVMVTVLSCGRLGFRCTARLPFPSVAGHLVQWELCNQSVTVCFPLSS